MLLSVKYKGICRALVFSAFLCLFFYPCFSQDPFTKAKEFFNKNQFEQSISWLDSCDKVRLYPDSVLCLRTYIALKSNDPAKATVYCNSLQIENRNYHEIMYLRALISSLKKKYALAAEQYTKFLNKESNNTKALYNRAWAKGNLEDYESAIEDLDKCIRIDPLFFPAYYQRGYWQEELGNDDEALKDYKQTLDINPDYKDVYVPLAYILNKKGEKDRACEVLRKAIDKGVVIADDLKDNYCK